MQDLTRLALVGTANVPTDVAASAAVAALLPDASAAATTPINREQRLLWQAGSEALYRSAGRLPERLPLPPPAAPETWEPVELVATDDSGDDPVCQRLFS